MNTSPRKLLAALAAFSLAVTLCAGPLKVGDAFPSLATAGLEGTVPELANKVVLVDFWASWCAPCKKAFPTMKELHEKYGTEGFAVVAISLDEDKADMDAFLKKTPVPFTILRDAKGKFADQLGVAGIPVSFILDRHGKVQFTHTGFDGEKTRKEYAAKIETLLKN